MGGFLASLTAWWHKPFTAEMDAVHVFLLTGLVITSIILWLIILSHLRNVKLSG